MDNEEEVIKSTIHRLGLDISITYFTIPSDKDYATADSLRVMMTMDKFKDKIMKVSIRGV